MDPEGLTQTWKKRYGMAHNFGFVTFLLETEFWIGSRQILHDWIFLGLWMEQPEKANNMDEPIFMSDDKIILNFISIAI